MTTRNWTTPSPDRLEFDFVGSKDEAVTLQRFVMNLSTLALHDVRVHVNEGSVPDEILVHALGLVPVVVRDGDSPSYMPYDKCPCRGARCKECSVRFTLYKTTVGRVYSHDFESSDPHVRLMRDVPLTDILRPGCTIKIEAYTKQGEVREGEKVLDAKWQCASPIPFFRHPIRVSLRPERTLTLAQKKELAASCPAKVFVLRDVEDLCVDPGARCTLCRQCERKAVDFRETADDPPLVDIHIDRGTFHFVVEMTGQLSVRTVKREIEYNTTYG